MANQVNTATKGSPLNLTTTFSFADTKQYLIQVIGAGEVRLVDQATVATVAECRQRGLWVIPGPGSDRVLTQVSGSVFTLLAVDHDATVIAVEA